MRDDESLGCIVLSALNAMLWVILLAGAFFIFGFLFE